MAIPASWTCVPPGVFDDAKRQVMIALDSHGPHPVQERLASYYDRDGDDAGASFVELAPRDPDDVTACDVHAVGLLGVRVGPAVTRRLLEHSANRSEVLAALREVQMTDLLIAGPGTLEKMETLYLALRGAWSAQGTDDVDPRVGASAVCARKRPELFPLGDVEVGEFLGLRGFASHRIDWMVYRSLIGDQDVIQDLDAADAEARRVGGRRQLRVDLFRLRMLDAALWTYTRTRSVVPIVPGEPRTDLPGHQGDPGRGNRHQGCPAADLLRRRSPRAP
ncbi:MAG: hypothetical protein HHJ10_13360 [Cellulomonas sp.]|nr:hypothetical protein [Cellulomonas sp.]